MWLGIHSYGFQYYILSQLSIKDAFLKSPNFLLLWLASYVGFNIVTTHAGVLQGSIFPSPHKTTKKSAQETMKPL